MHLRVPGHARLQPQELNSQLPTVTLVQPVGGTKELAIKKVIIVRSGDTLSHCLAQEYGEYTKAVVNLARQRGQSPLYVISTSLRSGSVGLVPERPE